MCNESIVELSRDRVEKENDLNKFNKTRTKGGGIELEKVKKF